ncbi:hypothetical protein WUBG_02326 [Wuchereria bancrofti]|uniref:Uncharacterized protein n=1 Tax=Wuchereria bancrofti TaxID=6293 RepID=J9EVZ0_WUCBA|nr:hypothetical protein WUBG_02326 [Wuchereria bancrofti]
MNNSRLKVEQFKKSGSHEDDWSVEASSQSSMLPHIAILLKDVSKCQTLLLFPPYKTFDVVLRIECCITEHYRLFNCHTNMYLETVNFAVSPHTGLQRHPARPRYFHRVFREM